jgi:hypothetical protein
MASNHEINHRPKNLCFTLPSIEICKGYRYSGKSREIMHDILFISDTRLYREKNRTE